MDAASTPRLLREAAERLLAGQADAAEALLRSVLQAAPGDADAWHLLGMTALQRGAHAQAVESIQRAIQLRPGVADQHHNLAGAFYCLDRWNEAGAQYRRAAELNPEFHEAWKGLGASLVQAGRFEDALEPLQKSLALDPAQPAVALQLADALERLGRLDDAVAAAQRALAVEPYCAEAHRRLAGLFHVRGDRPNEATAWRNVGESLRREGKNAEAIQAFRRALELHPACGKSAHALACLTGRSPPGAPRDYVIDLFNDYADRFDAHLAQLEYRVPEMLRAAVGGMPPPSGRFRRVLDLGCGPGKCGALFRDLAIELVGVDLAPRMVEKARARGVYDTLVTGDIVEMMRGQTRPFDLLLAADVFIYVGALEEVFAQAARLCAPGSLFAFSVEDCEGDAFMLRASGRFAHAPAYLGRLAREHGFEIRVLTPAPIRLQGAQPIPGWIYVLSQG
jgi:predicted TPR repeat methyltransferase